MRHLRARLAIALDRLACIVAPELTADEREQLLVRINWQIAHQASGRRVRPLLNGAPYSTHDTPQP